MKRLKYLLIAGVSLLLTSCENFLDRQPESSLSGETFWTSEQDLKTWNAGMYDGRKPYHVLHIHRNEVRPNRTSLYVR